MDYYRAPVRHVPLRAMGSPDGLGAYFQTTYTQPISPTQPGASVIAAYSPIDSPRPAASGLGAYFQTTYTQPISPTQPGASVIAAYSPIDSPRPAANGLGGGALGVLMWGAYTDAPGWLSSHGANYLRSRPQEFNRIVRERGISFLTNADPHATAWLRWYLSPSAFASLSDLRFRALRDQKPIYVDSPPVAPGAGPRAMVTTVIPVAPMHAKMATTKPTSGLGACRSCSAAGYGADAPAVSPLSKTWVRLALGFGAIALAWYTVPAFRKLWGPGGALSPNKRRHRRNGKWSSSYKNSLPDSAFLLVKTGGNAMIEHGHKVTIPRNLRKFPYRNRDGSVNLAHLRNAIARIPQSNIPAHLKGPLQAKARTILAEHGGYKRARRAAASGALRKAA